MRLMNIGMFSPDEIIMLSEYVVNGMDSLCNRFLIPLNTMNEGCDFKSRNDLIPI